MRRDHSHNLTATLCDEVLVSEVKLVNKTAVVRLGVLADFLRENPVVEAVNLLHLLGSLRLFELHITH